MKVKEGHYADLKFLIEKVVETVGEEKLRAYKEQLKNDKRVQDLNMRFHFDVLYASDSATRWNIIKGIYEYANDENIYTALKKIFRENSVLSKI